MKVLLLLLTLITVRSTAFAEETIVLGEYKGKLPTSVQFTDSHGEKRSYETVCDTAINLDMNSTEINFDFSVYVCGGMSSFNDKPQNFTVRGNDVYLADEKVGSFIEDTAAITIHKIKSVKKVVFGYFTGCDSVDTVTRNFELPIDLSYEFKKLNNNTYSFTRKLFYGSVYSVIHKNENCPNSKSWTDYEQGANASAMQGNLVK